MVNKWSRRRSKSQMKMNLSQPKKEFLNLNHKDMLKGKLTSMKWSKNVPT